jgi:predicted nucleic acid-binding protein
MNILNKGSILHQIKNYFSKPVVAEGETVISAGKEEAKFEKEESGIRFGHHDPGISLDIQSIIRKLTKLWKKEAIPSTP